MKLRDYPTLGAVIGFVRDSRPDLAAPTAADSRPPTAVSKTPPAAVVGQPSAVDPVTDKVLAIVAEQTGYPQEMLELDLDMEADLGIDTVKQAETFLAIRQAFDIPRSDNMKLRDYPTLGAVIGFVRDSRPDLATDDRGQPTADREISPAAVVGQPSAVDPVTDKVLAIVAEQTGYPQEMLELDLDMEADLGIDTVKQAETFLAIRQAFDIPRSDTLKLRDYPTLGAVIGFVRDSRPDLAATTTEPTTDDRLQTTIQATPPAVAVVRRLSPSAVDPVTDKVLAIVAEQTGYPQEMLELDLDMEADLGIDTVKQAETFLAIRQAFDIPRSDTLKLRDYPTLGAVIGFVRDSRPDLAVTAAEPTADSRPPTAVSKTSPAAVVGQPSSRRPSSPRPTPWPTPTPCPAACPCRHCGRRSTCASRPTSRWTRPAGSSSCSTVAAWARRW